MVADARRTEIREERTEGRDAERWCVSRTELSPKFIKTVNEIKRFNYTINLAVVVAGLRVASH